MNLHRRELRQRDFAQKHPHRDLHGNSRIEALHNGGRCDNKMREKVHPACDAEGVLGVVGPLRRL